MLKKSIISILFLLFLIYLIDIIIGETLRYFYFKEKSGLHYRTTYSIDSTKADVLVFGSSRANHHYVPHIFEDSLSMSFYNTGRDGNFLLYNYAVFKAIINRYIPKIVIFDINPSDLYINEESYDRLSSLLPYYKYHPEIRDIIKLRGPYEKLKLISNIYPYNSSLITIFMGNLEMNKKRKLDENGYVGLNGKINNFIKPKIQNYDGIFDTVVVNCLNQISSICKKSNIKLIFAYSPVYSYIITPKTDSLFNILSKQYNCFYLNYSKEKEFLEMPNYFQDIEHLNNNGAIKFSSELARDIKIIKNQ